MARIPRMLVTGEPTAYHVMSRTALDKMGTNGGQAPITPAFGRTGGEPHSILTATGLSNRCGVTANA